MEKIGGFERNFSVSVPLVVEVRSHAGQISIQTGPEDQVRVVASIMQRGPGAAAVESLENGPPIHQEGNTIRIGMEDVPHGRWFQIDYDLTVPARTRLSSFTGSGAQQICGLELPLIAASGSGDIAVQSVSADVDLTSGSGNLRVSDLREDSTVLPGGSSAADLPAKGVFAHTGSGDIEMSQIMTGKLEISTGSGNVRLSNVRGELKITCGSGTISAESQPTGDWHVVLGSGWINTKIPSESSFELDARTLSGKVRTTHPLASTDVEMGNRLRGKVGVGGVLVDLRCGSGDIEVLS